MNKKEFYSLVKSIPKAEIHVHSEAVISKNTIRTLFKEKTGTNISDEELDSLFSYNDLHGFIQSFIKIQTFFSKITDLNYIFSDLISYLQENNIVYCETFLAPSSFIKKGFSFSDISSMISKNTEEIEKNYGRIIRTIIDVSRSFGPENAQKNLDYVLSEKNKYIIGIGLGGDEVKGPARDYESVFSNAKKFGLHTVAHAGEDVDSSSIKDAVNILHAERIGHGITIIKDSEYMKELAQKQIPFEICPTSNLFTKKIVTQMKDHPVRQLFDAGLFITVNTDDPTFFGASLLDEYYNLYNVLNFTLSEIKQIILNGFKASFISDEQKNNYYKQVEESWSKWMKEHPDCNE